MPVDFDITLELAIIEREARRRIAEKMASQQLGLAFEGLVVEGDEVRED